MKLFCLILASCLLVGCGSTTPTYEPQDTMEVFHPPLPDPIQTSPIKFVVITKATAPLVLQDDSVYVALTWEDYLDLGKNSDSTLTYIKSQKVVLCYYRKSLNETFCQK